MIESKYEFYFIEIYLFMAKIENKFSNYEYYRFGYLIYTIK